LVGAAAWHKRDNYVEEEILQEERTLMMSHRTFLVFFLLFCVHKFSLWSELSTPSSTLRLCRAGFLLRLA
jgi:hypothetical protein